MLHNTLRGHVIPLTARARTMTDLGPVRNRPETTPGRPLPRRPRSSRRPAPFSGGRPDGHVPAGDLERRPGNRDAHGRPVGPALAVVARHQPGAPPPEPALGVDGEAGVPEGRDTPDGGKAPRHEPPRTPGSSHPPDPFPMSRRTHVRVRSRTRAHTPADDPALVRDPVQSARSSSAPAAARATSSVSTERPRTSPRPVERRSGAAAPDDAPTVQRRGAHGPREGDRCCTTRRDTVLRRSPHSRAAPAPSAPHALLRRSPSPSPPAGHAPRRCGRRAAPGSSASPRCRPRWPAPGCVP